MNEEQRMLYSSLVSIRNIDLTIRWSVNQLFFLIHSAGLSLAVTQLKSPSLLYFLVCPIGILASILWFVITLRMRKWLKYWNSKLAELEETDTQMVRIFGPELTEIQKGVTISHALLVFIALLTIVWCILWVGTLL